MQPQLGARKGGSAAVIALQTTAGDQGIVTIIDGVGRDELQLAHLVAAQGGAGQVVALYPQTMATAPFFRGAAEVLQGGWRASQVDLARVRQCH